MEKRYAVPCYYFPWNSCYRDVCGNFEWNTKSWKKFDDGLMERHQDMLKEAVPKVKQRITKNAVKGYPEAYPLCKQSQDLYSLSPEE